MRTTRLAIIGSALLAIACGGGSGGSDGPSAPAAKANATFQGVFASGLERGTISLVAGSPASGSLTLGTNALVPLSGTYNASTKSFAVSGGGYSVTATTESSGLVSGTVTGTGITGTGTIAAIEAGTATAPVRYCGVYMGDDSGMGDILLLGSGAVATITGMGGGIAMSGTVSGSSVSLTATGREQGTNKTNTITANLTLSGTTLSGSGSSTLYPTQRVSLTASSAGCAAPTGPSGPYDSYVGWVANNGYTGIVTLTAGTPATGSLTWGSGAPISLSGTFNATTGAFSVTGGGITVTATANGASLTGTATGALTPLSTASVSAMGSSATARVTRSCGTTSGGMTGKVILMQAGTTVSGIFVYSNTSQALNGTTGGPWIYLAGGSNAFFAGTGTSPAWSGTWAHTNITAGNWTVAGC